VAKFKDDKKRNNYSVFRRNNYSVFHNANTATCSNEDNRGNLHSVRKVRFTLKKFKLYKEDLFLLFFYIIS